MKHVMVVTIACAAFALGCGDKAKGGESVTSTPVKSATQAKGIHMGEAVAQNARWMHEDTQVFAVIDVAGYNTMHQLGLKSPDAEVQKKLDAHRDKFIEQVTQLSKERLGSSWSGVTQVVMGVNPKGLSWVLRGLKMEGEPTETVGGIKAYKIFPRHPKDVAIVGKEVALWGVPTKDGLAMFIKREDLEHMASSKGMSPQRVKAFQGLFGDTKSVFAMAAVLENKEIQDGISKALKAPSPTAAMLSVGPELIVRIDAASETLDKIHQGVMLGLVGVSAAASQQFPGTPDESNTVEAMGKVFIEYAINTFKDALRVDRTDGRIVYGFPLQVTGLPTDGGLMVPYMVGMGAAIGIPAFLRAIKKSKTSEAEQTLRKLADGAKSYFLTEQKYAGNQPWHKGAQLGYPVPWKEYTFPGGSDFRFETSKQVPVDGKKVTPQLGSDPSLVATLRKLSVSFKTSTYFKYTYTASGTGPGARVKLKAEADFDPSSPERHTMTQELYIDPDSEEVVVMPPVVRNEFE